MKRFLFEKAWHAMILAVSVWCILNIAAYCIGNALNSLVFFIFWFLLIFPISTFALCFWFAKKYGKFLMLQIPMFVIVIVEYIFFGFNHIEPNYIVMSALAILFGSGIGKQFCEFETENTIIKRINEKEKQKRKQKKNIKV